MIQKLTLLSCFMLSARCMVLHQLSTPLLYGAQTQDNSNYNYAYAVNDVHTGDIKSKHESRIGDTVLGQYSLLQPDGVRRTVDYRANDHTGFVATVNNEGLPLNYRVNRPISNYIGTNEYANLAAQTTYGSPITHQGFAATFPGAVSRTSIAQTFPTGTNPWY